MSQLAVLSIEMLWYKESRTPEGALRRKEYYQPCGIAEGVCLQGEGIFWKKLSYEQGLERIYTAEETYKTESENLEKEESKEAGINAYSHRRLLRWGKSLRQQEGMFYPSEKVQISCIEIVEEQESYRIRWFDDGRGNIRRRGGNEDFHRAGAKFRGNPNLRNETAFVLREGEAGVVRFNNRYTSYEGQCYKQYVVYFVNAVKLTTDVFLREYDFSYDQLADLF